jgi:nuclear pore complex protein Nup107
MYYSSHTLERHDLLSLCMVVSTWAANCEHITHAFVKSRRMAELVDVLALSSKALVIRESSQRKSAMDQNNLDKGQELKIWDVTVSKEEMKRLGILSSSDRGH